MSNIYHAIVSGPNPHDTNPENPLIKDRNICKELLEFEFNPSLTSLEVFAQCRELIRLLLTYCNPTDLTRAHQEYLIIHTEVALAGIIPQFNVEEKKLYDDHFGVNLSDANLQIKRFKSLVSFFQNMLNKYEQTTDRRPCGCPSSMINGH